MFVLSNATTFHVHIIMRFSLVLFMQAIYVCAQTSMASKDFKLLVIHQDLVLI